MALLFCEKNWNKGNLRNVYFGNANLQNLTVQCLTPNYLDDGSLYKKTPYSDVNNYYSSQGTVLLEEMAEPITLVDGAATGINMTLSVNPYPSTAPEVPQGTLSGTIYLPEGDTVPEDGLTVYVGYRTTENCYQGQFYEMTPGTSSLAYELKLMGNVDLQNLTIISNIPNYIGEGVTYKKTPYSDMSFYYTSSGTVLTESMAEVINLVEQKATGIDIFLSSITE